MAEWDEKVPQPQQGCTALLSCPLGHDGSWGSLEGWSCSSSSVLSHHL